MKTIERETTQKYIPQFGGNSVTESVSLIDLLFETYLDAGLRQTDAWDAALADYSNGFGARHDQDLRGHGMRGRVFAPPKSGISKEIHRRGGREDG